MFNIRLTANLSRNLLVKFVLNRLRFDRIMVMSLWPTFFGPPCRPRRQKFEANATVLEAEAMY